MGKLKIYLDNCAFNRPFDDQSHLVIRLETEAKLQIQNTINSGEVELVWSFVLDFENGDNPFDERRERIVPWKILATVDVDYSSAIAKKASDYMRLGLRQKDASHIACAVAANADYFITTDKKILNRQISDISLLNPIDFVRRYFDV
jgi:predicted nucleic acid-binding protein